MKLRVILSMVVLLVAGLFEYSIYVSASLTAGHAALGQFEPSDQSYLASQAGMDANNGKSVIPFLASLFALSLIWVPFIIKYLNASVASSALLIALFVSNAHAYYDHQDRPEYVEVGMNQSAFLIQEVGDNKNGQAKFMSQEYLEANKIAMKRIQIPHVIMKNPGWTQDMYIPAARLILVDRSPFMREWVASPTKGTSSADESFSFESADSVNINTGITISAVVKEEDAVKFLYNFGSVAPQGDPNEPATQFNSVVYGKSLEQVMDKNVRGKVQAVLAREFGKRAFLDCIKQKADIIGIVEKEVSDLYATKGITIEYIGFADSLNFDPAIQAAINKVVVANLDAAAADALNRTLMIKTVQADIAVKEGVAAAVQKWNGDIKLPSFMVVSDGFAKSITDLFSSHSSNAPSK